MRRGFEPFVLLRLATCCFLMVVAYVVAPLLSRHTPSRESGALPVRRLSITATLGSEQFAASFTVDP